MSNYTTDNPLAHTVEEAEELIRTLQDAAHRLQEAIANEKIIRARWQDAKEALESAESELIVEEEILSQSKEGRLAGIAKTGKAYDHAIRTMLNEARQNGLSRMAADANHYEIEYNNAYIELEQAKAAFSATKHASDLKAAILNALTGRY